MKKTAIVKKERMETIDASGKTLGRVASVAATALMGKDKPTFVKNMVTGAKVHIVNASKMKIDPRKMTVNVHTRYSGYPGGQKQETLAKVAKSKGYGEIFRHAVKGMIPNNKLRPIIMKRLTISE